MAVQQKQAKRQLCPFWDATLIMKDSGNRKAFGAG